MAIDVYTLTALQFFNLPYAFDALEPHIDARTMELHHDGHHAAYVNNLQKALSAYPGLEKEPVIAILQDLNKFPEPTRTIIRNNGGGHLNHTMFWKLMTPKGHGAPRGAVAAAIMKHFGSFDAFKEAFKTKAMSVFGSGWAWLIVDAQGALQIITTANQDHPCLQGMKPILGLDVWEHAYYLNYTNKRVSYIDAWWHVVNWDYVEELYRVLV